MRSWLLPLVVLALVAGCAASSPYAKPPAKTETKTQTVANGQFFMSPFGSEKDHPLHARVHVVVTQGGPIDAWLAGPAECGRFGQATFAPAGKLLNATDASFEADFDAPNATNTNCLILDNSPFAQGQAKPAGNVTVTYTIDLWARAS